MTYFCFVETKTSQVPHMEPLSASDLGAAIQEARGLLAHHGSAIAAHVLEQGTLVATLDEVGSLIPAASPQFNGTPAPEDFHPA